VGQNEYIEKEKRDENKNSPWKCDRAHQRKKEALTARLKGKRRNGKTPREKSEAYLQDQREENYKNPCLPIRSNLEVTATRKKRQLHASGGKNKK